MLMHSAEGVGIRLLEPWDADELYAVIAAFRPTLGELAWTRVITLADIRKHIADMIRLGNFAYAIIYQRHIIGAITVRPFDQGHSIGYWIGPHRNRGFVTQAVGLALHRYPYPVYALVHRDNIASQRVMWKSGFKKVGETEEGMFRFEWTPIIATDG